jgi:aspartate-semialdehyde dehydrogenase
MYDVNLAVVGASGVVGQTILKLLEERNLPVKNYYFFSSSRSAGKEIIFKNSKYTLIELTDDIAAYNLDIVLASAGAEASKRFAPVLKNGGALVIDNSSAWRMDPLVPLVVPEVNAEDAVPRGIIANPNCSTIQAVVALKPLYDKYGIKRIVYSTYQAVSGAGMGGYRDLKETQNGGLASKFPHPIANNCLPHIDVFEDSGYTKEEMKMINETRKILHAPDLPITVTCVRVPVSDCHSESINVELEKSFELEDVIKTLKEAPGVVVQNDFRRNEYPLAALAKDRDEVFVGRIRRDDSVANGLNLWVVSDNLRKGAATNAAQIAEYVMNKY